MNASEQLEQARVAERVAAGKRMKCPECGDDLEGANKPPGMKYSEENHYRCQSCKAFVVINTTGRDETAACKFLAEAKMKARVLEEILLKALRWGEE